VEYLVGAFKSKNCEDYWEMGLSTEMGYLRSFWKSWQSFEKAKLWLTAFQCQMKDSTELSGLFRVDRSVFATSAKAGIN